MSQPVRSRPKDYLVTAVVGNVARKIVWREDEPLDLDFPAGWTLAKVGTQICVFDKSLGDVELIKQNAFFAEELENEHKLVLNLPPAQSSRGNRTIDLTVAPLAPLKPPYMQQPEESYTKNTPRQLMLYQGMRYLLIKYRPVGSKLTAVQGGRNVFSYVRVQNGYTVTAHVFGVNCKVRGKVYSLPEKETITFSQEDFFDMVVVQDVYWWRFRAVQTPESMPPIELDDVESDYYEQKRFERSTTFVLSLLGIICLLSVVLEKPQPEVKVTTVALQAPKVIPHENMFKPPATPTPVPVVEQAKPTPEPKKVVEEKPKKKPEPAKVAKIKKPTPVKKVAPEPAPKVAKALPTKDKPKPPPMVKSENPPATGVNTAKTEAPTAAQNDKVLQSLSFLSSNSKAVSRGGMNYEKTAKKDFLASPTLGGGSKDAKALDSIASAAGDINIKTKSSRSISSNVNFGGKGKGLNDVQGKVGAKEIYGRGVGGLSGAGSGISVSGPGDLSEAEIEKALQKYLSKFQFCYEKALITDSSLGGNIKLQWTIQQGGKATSAKVLSSQMNNAALHSCIIGVLEGVPFPSPRGGSVVAKKVFNFKSSEL